MKLQDIMAETSGIIRAYAETGFYADFDSPRALHCGLLGVPTYLRRGNRRVVIWCESESTSSKCSATRSGSIYYHKVSWKLADFEPEDEKRYGMFDAGPRFWNKHLVVEKVYYEVGNDWYTDDFDELVRCRTIHADRVATHVICLTEFPKLTVPMLKVARKLKGFKTCPMENIVVRRKAINARITLGEPLSYTFENRYTGTTAYVS